MRLLLSSLLALLPASHGWAAGSRSLGGSRGTTMTAPVVTLPVAALPGNGLSVTASLYTAAAAPGTGLVSAAMPGVVPALGNGVIAAAGKGANGTPIKAAAAGERPTARPGSGVNGAKGIAASGGADNKDNGNGNGDGRSASSDSEGLNSDEASRNEASRMFDGAAPKARSTAVRWLGLLTGVTAVRSLWSAPKLGAAAVNLLDRLTPPAKRVEAANILARLNRPESLEVLSAAATGDAEASVREAASAALATVAATWQKALLRDAGISPRAGKRAIALRGLDAISRVFEASEIVDRLAASAAVDRDEDNRLIAIEALGAARSPKALVALWRLRGGVIEEGVLGSAVELAIARAESRLASSSVPLAAYRPPEGDLGGAAKQPLHYSALKKVISVAAFFTAVELFGSWLTGSVALKADAMHLAADLAVSVGALVAIHVGRRPPSSRKTYGYLKLEPVMGLASALFIAGMGLFAGYEAIGRLITPESVPGWTTMAFAVAGLLSNAISTALLWRFKEENLSLKGAFLHAALDAVGSIGIIVSAGLAMSLGWVRADPIATLAIVALVLHSTWDLAKRSWNVLIDAVPPGLDLDELEKALTDVPGVIAVYDLHAWSLNSAERSGTAVLLVQPGADRDVVLAQAKKAFETRGIGHSTVEIRPMGQNQR
jgi:cobalt-zinc-cadmium efflux system protein